MVHESGVKDLYPDMEMWNNESAYDFDCLLSAFAW